MKNKYKITIILISIIILLYMVANTFADYVSTASGSGSIQIAKWNVKVGDVDISSVGEHDISTEIQMIPVNTEGVIDGKIAPESEMIGSFTINPQDTEIDIEYSITIGDFICNEESQAVPVPDMQITKITVNDAVVTLDAEKTYSDKIDMGAGVVEVKIYAKWNSGDSDYLIGEKASLVKLPINVYVEQSNKKWQTILALFDSSGTVENKLHIGDWVTYDAGTWQLSEIESMREEEIAVTGTTSQPSQNFEFGGFATGTSRNDGAIEYNNGTYMYAKMYDDGASENKKALSGWRVFDIDETAGTVTLISAANPEDYYHPYLSGSEYGYISQYILTGTKHSSWTEKAEENYTIRNWDMYVNPAYGATSARVITKTDLDNWYSKYIVPSANTYTQATFQKIYSEPYLKYQNLIENHSCYWLSAAISSTYVCGVYPSTRNVSGSGSSCAFGVRVLVSIPLESYVLNEPISTRTVTEEGMTYKYGTNYEETGIYGTETIQTYNVWKLK